MKPFPTTNNFNLHLLNYRALGLGPLIFFILALVIGRSFQFKFWRGKFEIRALPQAVSRCRVSLGSAKAVPVMDFMGVANQNTDFTWFNHEK